MGGPLWPGEQGFRAGFPAGFPTGFPAGFRAGWTAQGSLSARGTVPGSAGFIPPDLWGRVPGIGPGVFPGFAAEFSAGYSADSCPELPSLRWRSSWFPPPERAGWAGTAGQTLRGRAPAKSGRWGALGAPPPAPTDPRGRCSAPPTGASGRAGHRGPRPRGARRPSGGPRDSRRTVASEARYRPPPAAPSGGAPSVTRPSPQSPLSTRIGIPRGPLVQRSGYSIVQGPRGKPMCA